MSFYNFTQVAKPDAKSDNSLGGKEYIYEESLCITEENRFQNEINPIKLADLEWGDRYKLDKLLKLQIQSVKDGQFNPDTYFGYDFLMIEEAFQWFDIARRDQEVQLLKRKSSAGFAQNTFVNQSLADFGAGNSMFKLQTKTNLISNQINERGFSVLMRSSNGFELGSLTGGLNQGLVSPTEFNYNDPHFNMNMVATESSSDDEGGDEAEKFKNTFLNNKSASKYLMMKTKMRNENNLLLKTLDQNKNSRDSREEDSNYEGEMEEEFFQNQPLMQDQIIRQQPMSPQSEEEYNNQTPKVLSSQENSDDEKEDRPLQIRTNFKVLEELIEESREESMRGDSTQQIRIPLLDNSRSSVPKLQFQVMMDNDDLEELKKDDPANGPPQGTNRMYDSDIFVMSNTTFDEDLPSLSSRRVSMGQKQPFRNEFLSFVDNSQDLSALKGLGLNSSQIEQITTHLFNQQHQNQNQNRKLKNSQQDIYDGLVQHNQTKSQIAKKNQHIKKSMNQNSSRSRDKPLTNSIQTLLQQDQTYPSTNLQSIMHEKKQSLTKFSNYLSSSNNLSPIPFNVQNSSSFFQFKNSQANPAGLQSQSQYNSMSSINFGYHRQQPSIQNSHIFQLNSGQFSVLSGGKAIQKQNFTENSKSIGDNHNASSNYKQKQRNSIEKLQNQLNSQKINQNSQKIGYHSPQCSLNMRGNLSPGPGYKIRDRNSLNQEKQRKVTRNQSNIGNIALHLSDSDISRSKFIVLSSNQSNKQNTDLTKKDQALGYSQKFSQARSKGSAERLINLTNAGPSNMSKLSVFNNQNSTTVDSLGAHRSNKTISCSDLKKQLNTAKLRKQKSDSKIDNASHLMFEGANSMITQKLLASIKQNVINKRQQQRNEDAQTKKNQTLVDLQNDSPEKEQEIINQMLNRQRSKSEIDTIYEIGNPTSSLIKINGKNQQTLQKNNASYNSQFPLSPTKSIKSVSGFPYNNGKTMSDINKFFEERSENNVSVQSQIINRKYHNASVNSQIDERVENQKILQLEAHQNRKQDTMSKESNSLIFNQKVSQSISGSTVLKEPSIDYSKQRLEVITIEDGNNSPQIKLLKNTTSQQSLKLNFGIQPHLVRKYQSPTAQTASQIFNSNLDQSQDVLIKYNNYSQIHNNQGSSLLQPCVNKTKSIPLNFVYQQDSKASHQDRGAQIQQFEESKFEEYTDTVKANKKQNNGNSISVIKQRIVRSPNKKSMMVLNSSIGSNSNNVSQVHVALGLANNFKMQ